jgi:HK97 family phage portal protein
MFQWAQTLLAPLWKAAPAEGTERPGPYLLSNGWLPAGTPWNYWQLGQNVRTFDGCSAMVEACVSAYSQTTASLPGAHWRALPDGGREQVINSALSRFLRDPNDYSSISDVVLNLIRRLYATGNAYALALRNDRSEIASLHLMDKATPGFSDQPGGGVYYALQCNAELAGYLRARGVDLAQPQPFRDVLHLRLQTPLHPLVGVSPIMAAALDLALSGAALSQQARLYLNGATPRFILETDEKLAPGKAKELANDFQDQTTGENAGRSPVASWGLKARPVTVSANDGKLADLLKMTGESVALAFRVPLPILGINTQAASSTESLYASWLASGLGFCLNHFEETVGLFFGLRGPPFEWLEMDTRGLLRSAFKEQMEGLQAGVIGGIYAPDEARALVDLGRVPGGHGSMPRVQQQVVPLSYGSHLQPPTPTPAAPPAPPPSANDPGQDPNAAAANAAIRAFRAAADAA